MKTYKVPTYLIVEANDDDEAERLAGEAMGVAMSGSFVATDPDPERRARIVGSGVLAAQVQS